MTKMSTNEHYPSMVNCACHSCHEVRMRQLENAHAVDLANIAKEQEQQKHSHALEMARVVKQQEKETDAAKHSQSYQLMQAEKAPEMLAKRNEEMILAAGAKKLDLEHQKVIAELHKEQSVHRWIMIRGCMDMLRIPMIVWAVAYIIVNLVSK